MMTMTKDLLFADVALAVEEGFKKTPKRLPSWMFYDETGDKLFQAIMHMPEYYLTKSEYEILETYKDKLLKHFIADGSSFDLVELGAGDGLKTEILLKHFSQQNTSFIYSPIDVSETALGLLGNRLSESLPDLTIRPVNSKYEQALIKLSQEEQRKVFLFMGANIGNFNTNEAIGFIKTIASSMRERDQILIGFDLKKDPRTILAAYDDAEGITRDFNLNLLTRLNRELDADFQPDQFQHYPFYNPETGMTKSYLVSLIDQEVRLNALDDTIHFNQWEVIHTEVSQKYDMTMIHQLAEQAGLKVTDIFYDAKNYFADVLLKK